MQIYEDKTNLEPIKEDIDKTRLDPNAVLGDKPEDVELEIPEHVLDFGLDALIPQPEGGTAKVSAGKKISNRYVENKTRTVALRKTVLRKLMSGTDKLHQPIYGKLLHLFGRREEVASRMARALGFMEYPRIRVTREAHNEDYRKKQSLLESSYVHGTPFIDHPTFVKHLKDTGNNYVKSLLRTFKELDPISIHKASLFNWLIDNRDPHLGNFMINHKKQIIPIDYGLSQEKSPDEKDILERPCPITTELWKKYPKAIIPKQLLRKINRVSPTLLKIFTDRLLPNYPEEQREGMLGRFKDKLKKINLLVKERKPVTVGEFYPEDYSNRLDGYFGGTPGSEKNDRKRA